MTTDSVSQCEYCFTELPTEFLSVIKNKCTNECCDTLLCETCEIGLEGYLK